MKNNFRTIDALRMLSLAVLCLFMFNCGNDDGGGPKTGYFAKTIVVSMAGSDMRFEFEYDTKNHIIRERTIIGGATGHLEYRYNEAGMISTILRDGTLFAHYEYDDSGILTNLEAYDGSSGSNTDYPVLFSDGTYSIVGLVPDVRVDREGQLLHHSGLDLVVTHTDGPGVHRHLTPQPARYFGEIGAYNLYNLTLSQKAVASIELRGTVYEAHYQKDGNNNITHMELVDGTTGTRYQIWDITYEERSL